MRLVRQKKRGNDADERCNPRTPRYRCFPVPAMIEFAYPQHHFDQRGSCPGRCSFGRHRTPDGLLRISLYGDRGRAPYGIGSLPGPLFRGPPGRTFRGALPAEVPRGGSELTVAPSLAVAMEGLRAIALKIAEREILSEQKTGCMRQGGTHEERGTTDGAAAA